MKKSLVLLSFLVGGISAWGQKSPLKTAPTLSGQFSQTLASAGLDVSSRTITCQDTLRYPLVKQLAMGTSNGFNLFDIWQSDNEAISQAYTLSGTSITISGVEFYGMNAYDVTTTPVTGTASVTVRAAIHSVDANNNPTTLLASATKVITSTTAAFHYVTFATPITVSGNYAVVLDVESAGGVYTTYINSATPNQTYDEDFARMKSTFYATSGGTFVPVPTFTTGFTGGPYNFEPIVAPIVSYSITGTATATPSPACLGTPVVFSGSATPTGAVNNRMYNYNTFADYFNLAQHDSTYAWVMGAGIPVVWNANHTYTYPTAGAKTPQFYTLGGFVSSCIEVASLPLTINALPTIGAGTDVSICPGASTTLDASGGVSYSWDNSAGNTEIVTVSPSATTTYTVTGTDANGCSNTDQVVVTISPLDDASFTYASNTVCAGSASITPTAALAGTYSSTAGLVINGTTGEIDVNASTVGTYVITHSVNTTCANSSTQSFTITTSPDASFSYASPTYCTSAVDPSPVFTGSASAGTFTSSPAGLSINAVSGLIDLSQSLPGTYTVTNSIAASGACAAASETETVQILAVPSATITGNGTICNAVGETNSTTLIIALSGNGPWDVTYTDGTTPTTVSGHSTNTLTLNVSTAGTYTVTSVTDAQCTTTGSGSVTVNTFSNPTVTLSNLPAVCENASAITLNQGLPAGGTYSGNGVTGSSFNPNGVATGSTITYSYTDANGCSATANAPITIHSITPVSITPVSSPCVNHPALTLAATPAGGSFSGTGVLGTLFNPATAGTGSHVVTYTFTNANGCVSTGTTTIVVDGCLSLDETNLTSLVVYPNPFQGNIQVSGNFGENAIQDVRLYSLEGKLQAINYDVQNGLIEVVVGSVASGVYFLEVVSDFGQATFRIEKQ